MKLHRYTEEQRAFLAERVLGADFTRLAQEFNEYFSLSLRVSQVKGACYRMGLGNGRVGINLSVTGALYRFKPKHIPWNKGMKGTGGWVPTQFKKGNRPVNKLPVGTERPDTEGYIRVKVAEPNKWKYKHKMLWEEARGPIPKGHALIFADRDKNNCVLENLLLVARKELLYLNRHGLIFEEQESTAAALNVAKVATAIYGKRITRPAGSECPGTRRDGKAMQEKKRLSVKEAAELTGIKPGTIHVLIKNYRDGKPMVSPMAKKLEATLTDLDITWEDFAARARVSKAAPISVEVGSHDLSLEELIDKIRMRLPGATITISL